jgi:hypothetical protein
MPRVQRIASVLSYATLVLMSVLVLAAITFLIQPEMARDILLDAAPVGRMDVPPGAGTLYILQIAGWPVLMLNLVVLWNMYALFCLYAQGDALSPSCGAHLRRIGLGLIVAPFLVMVYGAIASVLLTWENAAGARELTLAIDSQGLGFVIGGALLLFVGMSMREAAALAEENKGFV